MLLCESVWSLRGLLEWVEGAFVLHLAYTEYGTQKLLKMLTSVAQNNGKQKVWGGHGP